MLDGCHTRSSDGEANSISRPRVPHHPSSPFGVGLAGQRDGQSLRGRRTDRETLEQLPTRWIGEGHEHCILSTYESHTSAIAIG